MMKQLFEMLTFKPLWPGEKKDTYTGILVAISILLWLSLTLTGVSIFSIVT